MNDTNTSNPSIDDLVDKYVTLRHIKQTLTAKHKEEIAELEDGINKLSAALESRLDIVGAESVKTKHGTVSKTVKEIARVRDWIPFYKFVKEHEAFDMLYKRVNSKVVMEHFHETGELPDGAYTDNETVIAVRKPTSS